MKNLFIFICLQVVFLNKINAQLVVTNYTTAQQLVNNLLGAGITASNITYTGATTASGTFVGSSSNIGLNAGVVLTCGTAQDAAGANNNTSTSTDNALSGDSDLDGLASLASQDASVLEFDFVPLGDTLRFNYVFASEEYPEFAPPNGSTFNDVFGFFLTGANPAGGNYTGQNIALVPGSANFVSINNINAVTNSQYYIDNATGTTVQYDAFTTKLTAFALVNCGQTYHIKLAIADVGDGAYDSGVFLEKGSFQASVVTITANASVSADTIAVEGCTNAVFNFIRPASSNPNDSIWVHFSVGGTATAGVDYTSIADSILIPVGVNSVSINYVPINDAVSEPFETIIVSISDSVCNSGYTISATMYISDLVPVVANYIDATKICPNGNVTLSGTVTGGAQPYNYNWLTGNAADTLATISVNPSVDTSYVVIVGDYCNAQNDTDTVAVHMPIVSDIVINEMADTTLGCNNTFIMLYAGATGGAGTAYNYLWTTTTGLTIGNANMVFDFPATTTTYLVTVTDSCGFKTATDTVVVNIPNIAPFAVTGNTPINVLCPGTSVTLVPQVTGGLSPYNYFWPDGSALPTLTVNPSSTTNYQLQVGDVCGNFAIFDFSVVVPVVPALTVNAGSDLTMYCPNQSFNLTANANGGSGFYTYSWNSGFATTQTAHFTFSNSAQVTITVKDTCNRIATDIVNVTLVPHLPLTVNVGPDTVIECPLDTAILNAIVLGGVDSTLTYQWTLNGGSLSTALSLIQTPADATTYTFTATDICGNTATDDKIVTISPNCDILIPNIFTPNGDNINEQFSFKRLNKFTNTKVQIFDRWGKQIYASEDYKGDWNGDNHPAGVYYYTVAMKNGKTKNGYVTIMK